MILNPRQTDSLQQLLRQRTALEAQIVGKCRDYLESADIDPARWTGQLDQNNGVISLVLKDEDDAAP